MSHFLNNLPHNLVIGIAAAAVIALLAAAYDSNWLFRFFKSRDKDQTDSTEGRKSSDATPSRLRFVARVCVGVVSGFIIAGSILWLSQYNYY